MLQGFRCQIAGIFQAWNSGMEREYLPCEEPSAPQRQCPMGSMGCSKRFMNGDYWIIHGDTQINQPASWNHGPKNCTRCLHYSDPPLAPQDDTIAEWRKALQHALSLSQTASHLST